MKRAAIVLLCLMLAIPLSGCAPTVRLEERLIIRGMAVDFDGQYRITVQAYRSREEGGEAFTFLSSAGESVYEALDQLEEVSGKLPFYSELAMIVVGGEAIAHGLNDLLSGFVQENEVRMGVFVFACEGTASELIALGGETSSPEDTVIAVAKAQLSNNVLEASRLYNVVGRMQSLDQDALLPLLTAEKAQDGQTVYSARRVVCFAGETPCLLLGVSETETLGWLLGSASVQNVTAEVSEQKVYFRPVKASSRITAAVEEPSLSFTVQLRQNYEFLPSHPGVRDGREDEMMRQSKEQLAQDIVRRSEQLIDRLLSEKGSDVFSFGMQLRQQNPELVKTNQELLRETIRTSNIQVEISLNIGEG